MSRARAIFWLAAALLGVAPAASALEEGATGGRFSATQGPLYWVSAIRPEYAEAHPLHPPLELLLEAHYALGEASDGYVGPRRGGQNLFFTLSEFNGQRPVPLYGSAVRELGEQIVEELNRRGLIGVYVAPHPEDVDLETGRDLRPPGETELRLVIWTGRVAGVRSFATGQRLQRGVAEPVANGDVAARSPVQPSLPDVAAGTDLLDRDALDDYVAMLNRHPARYVNVVLTPRREPGKVYVDYMVEEARPWSVYSEYSDSGTPDTGDERLRLGFVHYQLTGHDDVLRLDYITSAEDSSTVAYFGSYEARLPWLGDSRWRAFGSYSEYSAEDLGLPGDDYEGNQWTASGSVITNVYGVDDLFLDVIAGARWNDVEIDNIGFKSDMPFFVASLGGELQRVKPQSRLFASLSFEHSLPGVAGTDSGDLREFELVGRNQIDDDWLLARWRASASLFLDPLLDRHRRLADRPLRTEQLTQELYFETRGQLAFGDRLPSHELGVLGGLGRVRGYPQSIVSGDDAVQFTAEYRYHVPFGMRERPAADLPLVGRFRVGPEGAYGRPDWDLMLRGFFDYGSTSYTDPVGTERDENLMSVGFGAELQVRSNLFFRVDWGVALEDVRNEQVESGDTEGHFLATVRY